jgi:hypothetical protein
MVDRDVGAESVATGGDCCDPDLDLLSACGMEGLLRFAPPVELPPSLDPSPASLRSVPWLDASEFRVVVPF